MKKHHSFYAILIVLMVACAAMMAVAAPSVTERIDNLLLQMTLEEKVGQLNMIAPLDAESREASRADVRNGKVSSYIWFETDAKKRNDYQRDAVEGSRLGIPLLFANDIIHGASVTFPIAPWLAGAFEPELFEKAARVAAEDTAAEGVNMMFSPMCDIARDQRWGRVAESCGEDPFLASLCVAAQVRGIQGTGNWERGTGNGVAACLKHFVGYSAVTGGRDYNESEISRWSLENLHLPPFRAGVDAGALCVMSSFNTYDGVPAAVNRFLLTDILRGELGFSGFVVSDWRGVRETIDWGVSGNAADAARAGLNAGGDMDMTGGCYAEALAEEVKAGRVPMSALDTAVRRVLKAKFRLGLFDNPYVDENAMSRLRAAKDAEWCALAKECAEKSIVLLKNDGILPLRPGYGKIALIGPFGDNENEMRGCWVGHGWDHGVVTLADSLREIYGERLTVVKGCEVLETAATRTLQDGTVVVDEHAGNGERGTGNGERGIDEAVAAAKAADVVIMAIGEHAGWTGENQSRADLSLTGRQQELFDRVSAVAKRKIISVVFSGRALSINKVWDDSSAALSAGQPGTMAGAALADLLTGKAEPTARLAMSIPWGVADCPCFYNAPTTGRPYWGKFRDREENRQGARFPFGFGLGYSTVEYGWPWVYDGKACVNVKNTGKRQTTETVQLYVRQNVCRDGARPVRELRGFKKISLAPGEEKVVDFKLVDDLFAHRNRRGEIVVNNGKYTIFIAHDSKSGNPLVVSR